MAEDLSNVDHGCAPGVATVRAVPGVIGVLDTGVPWVRTQAELDEEWDRLQGGLATLLVNGRARDYATLDSSQLALLGVYQTARWTLGKIPLAPTRMAECEVSGAEIRVELDRAGRGMQLRQDGWEFATGVSTWLMWITGAREELDWPGWEAFHPGWYDAHPR